MGLKDIMGLEVVKPIEKLQFKTQVETGGGAISDCNCRENMPQKRK